ncbi:septum formation protein Maf [Alloscardovia theropitheci]|uniref:Nucleoside triphosphate pyrophosphatase n=1 Tax=Alloscardovia theropitheci TaxID=2496842 RepID=A0A4V2MU06_9BIFI|nr:Maf family nucleotide pyrophosphatase [Alloscardovia theropitheci]TCD54509.1 septum formation protein Maf [Alloscardovia theropitheci]
MTIPVVLASQSPSRARLLVQAGVRPTIRVSHVDEKAVLTRLADERGISVDQLSIEERVLVLARAKARSVADDYTHTWDTMRAATGELSISRPLEQGQGSVAARSDLREYVENNTGLYGLVHGPVIIGCDSLFTLGDEVYGKPHTPQIARERLRSMRGNTGTLWTGHVVIDMSTGEMVQAISHAQVSFAQFSDEDLERYLETGEPLEVAGSFTLEGLGAAFIESIQGDPSGVIGLSLPTVRGLVEKLGMSWTSLWNAHKIEAANPYDVTPDIPRDNINQPGDAWVNCECGHKHWGQYGAAGILLARRDDEGNISHVAMQHRAQWSAEGGKWGIPGGAIASGESIIEGALREAEEEANIHPEDIDVVGAYCEDHGPWAYTTVFAFEKPGHFVEPYATDDESVEVCWVSVEDMDTITLLSYFKNDWPNFAQRLTVIARENRQ